MNTQIVFDKSLPNIPIEVIDLSERNQDRISISNDDGLSSMIRMRFYEEKDFWEILSYESYTDIIAISQDQMLELSQLWTHAYSIEKKKLKLPSVPSDLIISNRIPLQDILMEMNFPNGKTEVSQSCRIQVLNREDMYNEWVDGTLVKVIGKFEYTCKTWDGLFIGGYLCMDPNMNRPTLSMLNRLAFRYDDITKWQRKEQIILSGKAIRMSLHLFLVGWYSSMVALLHPTIRDVFQSTKSRIVMESNTTNTNTDRKSHKKSVKRYVKTRVIKGNSLKDKLYKNKKGIHRKCVAWHVIGHYRTCKSGKRVWIAPYWKGEKRHEMMGQPNNREIVIDKRG